MYAMIIMWYAITVNGITVNVEHVPQFRSEALCEQAVEKTQVKHQNDMRDRGRLVVFCVQTER